MAVAWGWLHRAELREEVRQDPGGHRQGAEGELELLPELPEEVQSQIEKIEILVEIEIMNHDIYAINI